MIILYWYKMGGSHSPSRPSPSQQTTRVAFIRLTTLIGSKADPAAAKAAAAALLKEFARDVFDSCDKELN